ncbi:hypothetical protein ACFYPN_13110 [Streptomyces sp. NPDC005576]|uniref:hypothetical protein n=1 Tax=unclassified Streptomyces TaxID=2593676 RepID=UPI0033E08681
MKYAKTAALLAGSVVALGTAAPAFAAAEAPTAPVFSLDTGLNQVMDNAPQVVDAVGGTVDGATETMKKDGTVGKLAGEAKSAAKGATPLLGGLSLGG